jgi:predicted  nucleic acid-binding Zn-ribbon protein
VGNSPFYEEMQVLEKEMHDFKEEMHDFKEKMHDFKEKMHGFRKKCTDLGRNAHSAISLPSAMYLNFSDS